MGIEFLERRVTAGFEKLSGEMNALDNALSQRITDTELRLATEVTALAGLTREVHGILVRAMSQTRHPSLSWQSS